MSIKSKDVEIDNRYLCILPFPLDIIVSDYLVLEISPTNLQNEKYVRLAYEDKGGIPVTKWIPLDAFSASVLEKLEQKNNDVNDMYGEISAEDLMPEIEKEKVDYLQEFIKLQSEYLRTLIEEKKDTDKWKG
ncbi:MAG: hypothetical protein NUV47_04230 [Patescibacteria group bacterium]|nr:hypothetical protein [Patescibacteria group bacterium]